MPWHATASPNYVSTKAKYMTLSRSVPTGKVKQLQLDSDNSDEHFLVENSLGNFGTTSVGYLCS